MILRRSLRLASSSQGGKLKLNEVERTMLPQCGTLRTTFSSARRRGVVTKWHPFEHHGTIRDAEDNAEYRIAGTRAFETVMPTTLYGLEGAAVSFVVESNPDADRVLVRSHNESLHARSYLDVTPPVRYHSVEFYTRTYATAQTPLLTSDSSNSSNVQDKMSRAAATTTNEAIPKSGQAVLFAKDIVVDMESLRRARSTCVATKDKTRGEVEDGLIGNDIGDEEAVPPTRGLKDMRSCRLFDKETNLRLKLRRRLGSDRAAEDALAAMQASFAATHASTQRTVVARRARGTIVAWSAIHHSGIIAEDDDEEEDASRATRKGRRDGTRHMCLIRNAHAFETALPTSSQLLHQRVTFDKTQYGAQTEKIYAENIVVAGGPHYASQGTTSTTVGENVSAAQQPRKLYRFAADEADESGGPDKQQRGSASDKGTPSAQMYGVIVRWSGGQGVVQGSNEQTYRIHSAADFVQLIDQHSRALRGAIVLFRATDDGVARELDIVSCSDAPLNAEDGRSVLTPGAASRSAPATQGSHTSAQNTEAKSARKEQGARMLDWKCGVLLSWWPQEQQGIIYGEDGVRYVLRDAEDTVQDYATIKALIKKGRKLRFCTAEKESRLVSSITIMPNEEATQAEVEAAELQEHTPTSCSAETSIKGHINEAVASPLCTSYWIKRMEKAGYNVNEVKQMQNRALTMDELDDDEDDEDDNDGVSTRKTDSARANRSKKARFIDSEAIMKKDHWWNDPRKNIHFPNSDLTAGHLALIGPASMLNMAIKASDPKRLEKMTRKYQSRLTEAQKEYAWTQAKELAPKYEAQVKKARERNEEPQFYFF